MRLQILVPQYNLDLSVIKPLLDSIALQQYIPFEEIGVIITNDGSDVLLGELFLSSYPFLIQYHVIEHKSVSAARNNCLDHATADYVMFCDADDMFTDLMCFYYLFNLMNYGFDMLISSFMELIVINGERTIIPHDNDGTFVHGKVLNRLFLLYNNIRWNDDISVHEDSYFFAQCAGLANPEKTVNSNLHFYIWKYRADSVSRNDDDYLVKTYCSYLDSMLGVAKVMWDKEMYSYVQSLIINTYYDCYYLCQSLQFCKKSVYWYKRNIMRRMKKFILLTEELVKDISITDKMRLIKIIQDKYFKQGFYDVSITFNDWKEQVMNIT